MSNLGQLSKEHTALVIVDIQGKFEAHIHNFDEVLANTNILSEMAEVLALPILVTEQYPRGLGRTSEKVYVPKEATLIEKTHFSCYGCDDFSAALKTKNIKNIILCGIETHICVLQTALDLIANGYNVHLVCDAVSSRKMQNKKIALNRLQQAGAFMASTEMVAFQLLKKAGGEQFKRISKLIK